MHLVYLIDADTKNPKIKSSVKAMIDKQIEDFEKEYPVIKDRSDRFYSNKEI